MNTLSANLAGILTRFGGDRSRHVLRVLVLVSLAFITSFASAEPLVSFDFASGSGNIVHSKSGNCAIYLNEGVKIDAAGPDGGGALIFDGSSPCPVRIDAKKAAQQLSGNEVSVSFLFRADKLTAAPMAFGHTLMREPYLGEAPVRFNLKTAKTTFGVYSLWSRYESPVTTGTWHHVAFQYSVSNLFLKTWLDGNLERSVKIDADEPAPIEALFEEPFASELKGERFHGAIAGIKIWNTSDPGPEFLRTSISENELRRTQKLFGNVAKNTTFKPFADWLARLTERADTIAREKTADVERWFRLQEYATKLPKLALWAGQAAQLPGVGEIAKLPFLPLDIYEYDQNKRLPWRLPHDGRPTDTVEFFAALGEFEGKTFMAFPYADVEKFNMTPSPLKGPNGATLPSSVIDIRVVKVWYTSASGWNSYFGGGRDFPSLSPELLLHDDALVKVVPGERKNYLRLNYARGTRYVDISQFGTPESIEAFDINKEPIHDAMQFQPLSLREGRLSQFWLTVKVPADATPGKYSGKLLFSANGSDAGSMNIALTVHPFSLPRACTRYNTEAPFTGTWMHAISLSRKLSRNNKNNASCNNFSNAYKRVFAEYKNLSEHNCIQGWGDSASDLQNRDLAAIQMKLMRDSGQQMRPFWGGGSASHFEWIGLGKHGGEYVNKDVSPEALPELYSKSMNAFSNSVKETLDFFEQELGHREVYFYGVDEAGPATVRRQMPFFATIKHFGGRVFITSGVAEWAAFAIDADDVPAAFGRGHARNWHEGGSTAHSYAAPFSGPENPELWRRNKGMRLYLANFDGGNEYVWYEGINVWNDFLYNSRYKPFAIVYPTADGVIDTIAWESEREGFDDVRYMTLLRRLAKAAMREQDRNLVRLGRRATAWAEMIDPDSDDLDAMRLSAADWIRQLQNALQKAGVDIARHYQ